MSFLATPWDDNLQQSAKVITRGTAASFALLIHILHPVARRLTLRKEYAARGYQEVQTPNMYDVSIWKQSGHWQHYKEDMFKLDVEKRDWALKPMNCPGHFVLFGHRDRSYREVRFLFFLMR